MTTNGLVAARKIPLPAPKSIFLKVMSTTGGIRTMYPTLVLSYINTTTKPPCPDFLVDIQAFATNFVADEMAEDSPLEVVAYANPRQELFDFADGHYLKFMVNTKKTSDFFHRVEEEGRYVVIINADLYTYRALIDDSSGEILEALTEHRNLH